MRPTFDVSGNMFLWFTVPSIPVLLSMLLRRVRARLRTADPVCLERLRRQGVLRGDIAEEYRQLTQLLAGITPVVWLRERTSVRLYGCGVRLLHGWLPRRLLRCELERVAAYRAHRYASALSLVEQLRDDRIWGRQLPESWAAATKSRQ